VARTAAIAGTATAVSNRVSRRQARRWGAQAAPADPYADPYAGGYAEPAPAPAPPPPPSAGSGDPIALLQELGRLHESGTLTDEEFTAQKTRILAQM